MKTTIWIYLSVLTLGSAVCGCSSLDTKERSYSDSAAAIEAHDRREKSVIRQASALFQRASEQREDRNLLFRALPPSQYSVFDDESYLAIRGVALSRLEDALSAYGVALDRQQQLIDNCIVADPDLSDNRGTK